MRKKDKKIDCQENLQQKQVDGQEEWSTNGTATDCVTESKDDISIVDNRNYWEFGCSLLPTTSQTTTTEPFSPLTNSLFEQSPSYLLIKTGKVATNVAQLGDVDCDTQKIFEMNMQLLQENKKLQNELAFRTTLETINEQPRESQKQNKNWDQELALHKRFTSETNL